MTDENKFEIRDGDDAMRDAVRKDKNKIFDDAMKSIGYSPGTRIDPTALAEELISTRENRDYWWDAWKCGLKQFYELRDRFDTMKKSYRRAVEELKIADETVVVLLDQKQDELNKKQRRIESLQKSLAYWRDAHTSLWKVVQAANSKANDYMTRLDNLNKNYNTMMATREKGMDRVYKERQIALNENTKLRSAKTARVIGADLGHWQGFKFETSEDGVKPRTTNWLKPDPYQKKLAPAGNVEPKTKFAIGGRCKELASGAMGFYGTETTTIKILDDMLSTALSSLLEENEGIVGSVGSEDDERGPVVGRGPAPEISAAVTIKDGCRITLKLKVGRASYDLETFLTNRPTG